MPFAEESGLIVAIDRFVLREACRWARQWSQLADADGAIAPIVVSVNLSPRFLRQDDVVADIMRALDETGVDPRCMQIELTERSALTDLEVTSMKLRRLRALGVRVAIDDFGTGYSSLSYLKQLPIDVLKLDKSLLDSIDTVAADVAIVQAAITMGHALGHEDHRRGCGTRRAGRPVARARLRHGGAGGCGRRRCRPSGSASTRSRASRRRAPSGPTRFSAPPQGSDSAPTLRSRTDNRTVRANDGRACSLTVAWWAWVAVIAFIMAMLAVDLMLHRDAHEIATREALTWSAIWVAIALAFGGVLWATLGSEAAGSYYAGWLIEKSLSVDNLFVFALLFSFFAVPVRYQHRVLFWGVLGALVFRAIFIFAGAALLESFHWMIFVFGGVPRVHGDQAAAEQRDRREPRSQPGAQVHAPPRADDARVPRATSSSCARTGCAGPRRCSRC